MGRLHVETDSVQPPIIQHILTVGAELEDKALLDIILFKKKNNKVYWVIHWNQRNYKRNYYGNIAILNTPSQIEVCVFKSADGKSTYDLYMQ